MYYTTLETYIKKYEANPPEYSYHAKTREEHAVWKKALRGRLQEITGMDRCVPCAPDAQYLRTDILCGLEAEYWTIHTEPDIVMPFYLLRPENQKYEMSDRTGVQQKDESDSVKTKTKTVKRPVLIVPHGHGGGKESTIFGMTNFIRDALADGYLVICPDERGSSDRREFPEQGEEPEKMRMNSHRELLQVCISFGQSVIGLAVWDLMRLADYLLALPESSGYLACAGMSGGGQQTVWFAAMDDRVKAAITSGYFYGFKESLIELPQNCACNFVPHMFETADMGELGALIAPRPFFIESGEKDGLNGKNGLKNVISQLEVTRQAYRLLGEVAYPVHSTHPGGHQWVGTGMREFLKQAMKKESSNG